MRDAQRLELKPDEYQDAKREERRRHLRQVLAILRRAREDEAEWYVWVLERRDRRARALAGDDDLVFEDVDEELVLL